MTRLADRYGLEGTWWARTRTAVAEPEHGSAPAEGSARAPRARSSGAATDRRLPVEAGPHPAPGEKPRPERAPRARTRTERPRPEQPQADAGSAPGLFSSYALTVVAYLIPLVFVLPLLWAGVWLIDLGFTGLEIQPSPSALLPRAALFWAVFASFLAGARLLVRGGSGRRWVAGAAWLAAAVVAWLGCVAAQRASGLRVHGGLPWEMNLTAVLALVIVALHLYLQQWVRERGSSALRRTYEA